MDEEREKNDEIEEKEDNSKDDKEEINIKVEKIKIKYEKDQFKSEIKKENITIKEKEEIPEDGNEISNLVKLTEKEEAPENKENEENNKEKIDEIEQKLEKLQEEEIKNIKLIPKKEFIIVVIHNITPNVTEGHLKEIFSNYGEVEGVFIPKNKETMLKKNYAFIEFTKKEQAEKAQLYMDEGQIDGKVVRVEILSKKNCVEIK